MWSKFGITLDDENKKKKCEKKNNLCRRICQLIVVFLLELILKNIYYFFEIIIKIVLQIFEFFAIIILTNIIIEFNIIFTCSLIKRNLLIILSFLFNVIFSYISTNILTIFYYEFSQFSWMKYDTINKSLQISILKDGNKSEKAPKDDYNANYETIFNRSYYFW